jgi:hypothetical protein
LIHWADLLFSSRGHILFAAFVSDKFLAKDEKNHLLNRLTFRRNLEHTINYIPFTAGVVIPSTVRGHEIAEGSRCGAGQPTSPIFTILDRAQYIRARPDTDEVVIEENAVRLLHRSRANRQITHRGSPRRVIFSGSFMFP